MSHLEQIARDPRVTVRRPGPPDPDGAAVVYWMQRSQRAVDNPALDDAIEAGNLLGKPVVAFLGVTPFYPNANLRAYTFLAQGIPDIAAGLAKRGVGFVLRPWPHHHLARFCDEVKPCLVIGDENPLRETECWRQTLAERLRAPLWTVDADVVVPARLLAKEQYAARTIRPRIHALLGEFLKPGTIRTARRPWHPPAKLQPVSPEVDFVSAFPIDRRVNAVTAFRGGTREALKMLKSFVARRLTGYALARNKPDLDGTSRLSPYLHFGHIGPLSVALTVRDAEAPRADREAFLEEMIVRRELAINFVRFNPHYDSIESAEPWARKTLATHSCDERQYIYTERQLEDAETHDPLWNAAQRQMVCGGWMHGYMRMYWAKKILEWTRSASEAYAIAIRLNDRYELDGRDPNGYAGIAWAIAGKHDRPWFERPVYGTIRYMSYGSTSKKFDAKAYIDGTAGIQERFDCSARSE
jgi:deoxyribodipyrimidine photo-lyase